MPVRASQKSDYYPGKSVFEWFILFENKTYKCRNYLNNGQLINKNKGTLYCCCQLFQHIVGFHLIVISDRNQTQV